MRSFKTARGKILIREAGPSDAIKFRELRLGALLDSPIAFSADYRINLSHPTKYWEDMLTPRADESTIFLAEYESDLVGMTGIVRGGTPKTRHGVTIWGVYVLPEWRGLHIAEELIKSCCGWAKTQKIVIAKLGVAVINKSAVRCYERCGFKIYGTEPRALLQEGKYYDFHMMFRLLEDE